MKNIKTIHEYFNEDREVYFNSSAYVSLKETLSSQEYEWLKRRYDLDRSDAILSTGEESSTLASEIQEDIDKDKYQSSALEMAKHLVSLLSDSVSEKRGAAIKRLDIFDIKKKVEKIFKWTYVEPDEEHQAMIFDWWKGKTPYTMTIWRDRPEIDGSIPKAIKRKLENLFGDDEILSGYEVKGKYV